MPVVGRVWTAPRWQVLFWQMRRASGLGAPHVMCNGPFRKSATKKIVSATLRHQIVLPGPVDDGRRHTTAVVILKMLRE
jgi:hypothetical protein